MSEHAMPLLIINMGGEMLYILEQRLQAQSIVEEKSIRVLQDVISTMFSEKFVSELFKPQKIYNSTNTRQIFDRLAHSSIMRLNQSSMDKLYDLMTMGFKYQVLSCTQANDLLAICLNHIDALRKLIHNPDVVRLLDHATTALLDMFKDIKLGQFILLRQTLCKFFQDRRVKVSLFLQDQIQAQDGSIIISQRGALPRGGEIPGTVRYFDDNGRVVKEEVLKVAHAEGVLPPHKEYDVSKTPRGCELGSNLYAKDRRKGKTTQKTAAKRGSTTAKDGGGFEADEGSKATAKAELNLLASMIGSSSKTSDKDGFSLNLFPDTALSSSSSSSSSSASAESLEAGAELIVFDVEDVETRKKELGKKLGKFGEDEDEQRGQKNQQTEDDLLDLMDNAM